MTCKKIPYDLSVIYTNTRFRSAFSQKIYNGLDDIEEGKQCVSMDYLGKYIKLGKLIGTGDWGNVYTAWLTKDKNKKRKFAIKMSRITEQDLKDPYTESSHSWYEFWILKDIFKPIVENNVCPNLPLFINTFLCEKGDFIFRKGYTFHPCVITLIELASGDMRDYLKFEKPSDEELFSALFQIMAGLHCIQMSGQILNNDIKAKNILYYNVNPGGYWHYRIQKEDFYVPNYGKMFVLNDFGVSTLYNPNFQLYPNKNIKVFNLGSRYAINIDGKLSPIDARVSYTKDGSVDCSMVRVRWVSSIKEFPRQKSYGATYKLDRKTGKVLLSHTNLTHTQKAYLFKKGVTTNPKTWEFFEHPFYIPPFEFYNDVQDTLRTFVGGKRTTQRGNHILYNSVSKYVQDTIKPYMGKEVNSKQKTFTFDSHQILAGEFLLKFFKETHNYTNKPNGDPRAYTRAYYNMNKLFSKS